MGTYQTFNFNNSLSNHVTDGATALKTERDILEEKVSEQKIDQSININSDVGAAEILVNETEDSLVLKNEVEEQQIETNGLENFGLEEETPNLFETNISEEASEKNQNILDENSEEDELEIPAFLRRQKN